MKKSINRITLINILSTVLLQGISFISAPIFSRLMGTANYGVFSLFQTWTSVITTVFSLQTVATVSVAPAYFKEEEQPGYQSSVLFLSIASYAVLALLSLLLLTPLSMLTKMAKPACILMLVLGFAQMCISFANAKFTIEFRADNNLKLSLSSTLLGVALSLVLFRFISASDNYYARMLGITIPEFCIAVGLCWSIFKNGRKTVQLDYWKFCLPIALPCIFHSLSGLVLNQSDRIMIQRILGESQVGIYSLAFAFGNITHIIYLSLNNSWIPFYFEDLREQNIDGLHKRARNYTELFTVLSVGFVLLSPEVYRIFASEEYWEGGSFVALFVLSSFFTFLYSFPVNYEAYCKNSKVMAMTTMFAALLNIGLNLLFIRLFGTIGAVIATVISHFLQFALHHICARYWIKQHVYPFKIQLFLPYILCLGAVIASCYAVGNNFAWIRWGLGAVVGAVELYRIVKRKTIF